MLKVKHSLLGSKKDVIKFSGKIQRKYGKSTTKAITKSSYDGEIHYSFCWGACKYYHDSRKYWKGASVSIDTEKNRASLLIEYDEQPDDKIYSVSRTLIDNNAKNKHTKFVNKVYVYKPKTVKKHTKLTYSIFHVNGNEYDGNCGDSSLFVGESMSWGYKTTGPKGTYDTYNRDEGIKKACGEW